jgi:hypothetical protein
MDDLREQARIDALTVFLEERLREGYVIESRTDTHAIIAPASVLSSLNPFSKVSGRQVVSVDDEGHTTMAPAEPLRS